jgi:CO/xanthine dehydrogenase Mo-binding subunit
MLTRGHLAQHVPYHVFHGPGAPANAPQLFGVTRDVFLAARQAGLSPEELARRAGRRPARCVPASSRCSPTRPPRA